jgi:hypothetical protein
LFFSSGKRCRLVRGRFRVRVFLWIPTTLQNCPPLLLCVLKTSIYRQKCC